MRSVVDWIRRHYGPGERVPLLRAYHDVFEKSGGPVLEDLRRFCYVYDTTHVPGDPAASNINEGKRQTYIHIVQMLETQPSQLVEAKPSDDRDTERPPEDDED